MFRSFGQAHEHRLVSAMNAVEVADGQCDMALGDSRKTPEYMHALARSVGPLSWVTECAEDIEKPRF
jgi:hypothetical protein